MKGSKTLLLPQDPIMQNMAPSNITRSSTWLGPLRYPLSDKNARKKKKAWSQHWLPIMNFIDELCTIWECVVQSCPSCVHTDLRRPWALWEGDCSPVFSCCMHSARHDAASVFWAEPFCAAWRKLQYLQPRGARCSWVPTSRNQKHRRVKIWFCVWVNTSPKLSPLFPQHNDKDKICKFILR